MVKRSNPTDIRGCESATYQSKGNVRLDKEKGILYGCKVLGWESVHNRKYVRRGVESAVKAGLYNAKSNLNHAKADSSLMSQPDVPIQARFGKHFNARVEDDGVYTDYKYLKKHPFAPVFEEMAEEAPDLIGFSPDHIYRATKTEAGTGKKLVDSIVRVFSIDLVADPGTTRGLHESAAGAEPSGKGENEDASLDMGDLDAIAPGPDEEDEHNPQLEAAINLISEVLRNKALAHEQKKAKVLAALQHFFEEEPGETSETEEPEEPETPMSEPNKGQEAAFNELQTKFDALEAKYAAATVELDKYRALESAAKTEKAARDLCKTAGLDPKLMSDVFVAQLCRVQESATRESEWERMIADRKGIVVPSKSPMSAAPGDKISKDKSFEEFKNFAFGGSK